MANTCPKAKTFFGVIQRLYTILVKSSKRWQILKDNVKNLTLKPLSTTRWESRVDSVKAIRFQIKEIRDALQEVAKVDLDPMIRSEADSLAEFDLGKFEFLLAVVIWFDLLSHVNVVSKRLQKADMIIDVAIKEAISSLKGRFEQYQGYKDLFGFLFTSDKLHSLDDVNSKSCCTRLENALKSNEHSDIDGDALYVELKLVRQIMPNRKMEAIEILNYLKDVDCFPNAVISYRILLTIPVTVASAERSFSKLKLVKSYMRSTMSQNRLNGLGMMAIENEMLEQVNCEELIDDFASKTAGRVSRFKASLFLSRPCQRAPTPPLRPSSIAPPPPPITTTRSLAPAYLQKLRRGSASLAVQTKTDR